MKYLLAILALLCATTARADTELLIFTDPPNCAPCRELEKVLNTKEMRAWLKEHKCEVTKFPLGGPFDEVTVIPTLVLYDSPKPKILPNGTVQGMRKLRRHVGYLDAAGLRKFIEGGGK